MEVFLEYSQRVAHMSTQMFTAKNDLYIQKQRAKSNKIKAHNVKKSADTIEVEKQNMETQVKEQEKKLITL